MKNLKAARPVTTSRHLDDHYERQGSDKTSFEVIDGHRISG